MDRIVESASDMERLGAALAVATDGGCVVFLHGELGAGKTTLVRGFLRGLGYAGAVKSPTFTLVEPYEAGRRNIYHFDLYRLSDPEELDYLGSREYFDGRSICLVEWPEHGQGALAAPDITIHIAYHDSARHVSLTAHSDSGNALLARLG